MSRELYVKLLSYYIYIHNNKIFTKCNCSIEDPGDMCTPLVS